MSAASVRSARAWSPHQNTDSVTGPDDFAGAPAEQPPSARATAASSATGGRRENLRTHELLGLSVADHHYTARTEPCQRHVIY
ncbi:hypothetical protein Afe04nite_46890 [Asanoa ferruginea]|nr:hypothetical protein Afe04nite_46890 [Asanoa ferruginea]